jgi:hypothetical protein
VIQLWCAQKYILKKLRENVLSGKRAKRSEVEADTLKWAEEHHQNGTAIMTKVMNML